MRMPVAVRGFVLSVASFATAASAHHGTSQYDMDQEIVLAGTVAEWRWSNPHAWLQLDAVNAAGQTEQWSIESAPLGWLDRNGWSGTTLVVGERIIVKISPTRVGERGGIMREVTHANGETRVIRRPRWAG